MPPRNIDMNKFEVGRSLQPLLIAIDSDKIFGKGLNQLSSSKIEM
jgi:hypothetical protein